MILKLIRPGFGRKPYPLTAVVATMDTARETKTVLVAAGDAATRQFTTLVLRGMGYRILEAENGPQVLDFVRRGRKRIDLLLTDLMTQFTSGDALAYQLWSLFPKQRALFCSPYPEQMARRVWRLDPEVAFLQKPYSSQRLANRVQTLLDAPELSEG